METQELNPVLKKRVRDRSRELMAMVRQRRGGFFFVLSLLMVSAVDFFYLSQNYILIAFALVAVFFIFKGIKPNKNFLFVFGLFFVVEVLQFYLFGGFNIRTFAGTYIRLFLAFATVALLGHNFYPVYVRVMYFFSVVSLLFYAGSFLPGAEDFYLNVLAKTIPNPFEAEGFYKNNPNFVIVTFNGLFKAHRNSGPFWEPGAYAVFLILALLFNHFQDGKLTSRKNLVFIIALITTFSTAGYIAFFLFLIYLNFHMIRKNVLYVVLLCFLVAGMVYFYETVPFLKEKILRNIELADETTSSRFGSALADSYAFQRSPLVGLGRAGAKEGFISASDFSIENHRNNGVFDLLSKYGLPLTLIYFFLIYRSFYTGMAARKQDPLLFAVFSTIIIMLLGFSQGLFLKPFFYAFLFLPFAHQFRPRYK